MLLPIKALPNKSIEEVIQNAGAINDNSTCAANTTATGEGITTAYIGRKAIFTITSRDSQNFQRKLRGDVFKVKLKSEVGGDEIYVELNDREDGTYSAEYTVDKLYGNLILSVCLRGAHINGSPFFVRVETPRPTQKTTYPQYPRSLLSGHGYDITSTGRPPLSRQKPQHTLGSYSLSTGYNATGTCTRRLTPKRGSPYRF